MSDYVCEESIVEIFTRLPPKSLLRFRSLSKSWYSCISSPRFIRKHTFQSPQKLLFRHRYLHYNNRHRYLHYNNNEYDEFCTLHAQDQLPLCPKRGYIGITPLKFPFSRNIYIMDSCNGIFYLREDSKCFYLWNPSIRRIVTLPHCPARHIGWNCIGIGFDPISDDYKIVVISRSSYVYAMKTGAWRAIASPTLLISHVLSKACFVNGALHWIVDHPYIITFDLNTDVFGTIPLPKPFPEVTGLKSTASLSVYARADYGAVTGLTTIQGSLAVYTTGYGDSWIWVRKDASWSVVHKWKANQVGGSMKPVLELTTNSDLLLYTHMEGFQVYNPRMGPESRRIHSNDDSHITEIVPHVESLDLLDMGTASE